MSNAWQGCLFLIFQCSKKHVQRETKAGAPIRRISPGSCRVESSSFTLDAPRLEHMGLDNDPHEPFCRQPFAFGIHGDASSPQLTSATPF